VRSQLGKRRSETCPTKLSTWGGLLEGGYGVSNGHGSPQQQFVLSVVDLLELSDVSDADVNLEGYGEG
jgi:hypothetical protein